MRAFKKKRRSLSDDGRQAVGTVGTYRYAQSTTEDLGTSGNEGDTHYRKDRSYKTLQYAELIGFGKSRAFRCLWALEELGIPYQHIPVKPHSEEAKQYNPLGKIPILVDEEGFCIFEANASIGYLCDTNSEKNLISTPGTKERGSYEQTMPDLATELDSHSLWINMKHKLMADKFGEIPDVEHARN